MTKAKDIPVGRKAIDLGLLPEEWILSKLESVAQIIMGQSPPGTSYNETGEGKPFLQGKAEFGEVTPKNIKYTTNPKKIAPIGSVLMSVRAPVGDVNIASIEYCIGRGLASISLKNGDNQFLFFLLQYLKDEIDKEGTGSIFKSINKAKLSGFEIPLPPLPEQRAIATTLRTVQEAKERTDAVIAATKALKVAMMKHLFTYGLVPPEEAERVALNETEIGSVPEEWDVVKLGEVSEFLQYGTSKKCDYDVKGYPVLRIPNIVNGIIDSTDLKFLDTTIDDFNKIQLKIGDILFVRTNGVRNLVGRCAIYQGEPENSLFASYLIRVRLKSDRALPAFVQYYAETPSGREFLSGQASGSADGKFNINTQTIKRVILPLPDVMIQKKIVDIIFPIDQKLAAEQSRKEALDTMFTSLLHDLMTAKIRVKLIAV
jgi:type I restriction enzyme, S subunit